MRTMVRKDEIPDKFQELTVFLEVTGRRSVNKTNQKRILVSQWKLYAEGIGHRLCWEIEVDKWGGRSFRR